MIKRYRAALRCCLSGGYETDRRRSYNTAEPTEVFEDSGTLPAKVFEGMGTLSTVFW